MILAAFAALLALPSGTEAQTPRNNPPTFTEGDSTTRAFNETLGDAAITTASNIGRAVDATDPNTGTTLEYSLEGTDAPKFGIISTSGQIQTKVGERYDHEAKPSYTVTVRVVDGDGSPDKITVTLNVTDQDRSTAHTAGADTASATGQHEQAEGCTGRHRRTRAGRASPATIYGTRCRERAAGPTAHRT